MTIYEIMIISQDWTVDSTKGAILLFIVMGIAYCGINVIMRIGRK